MNSISLENLELESYSVILEGNTYIDNSASKQNGIINIINAKKLSIQNERYYQNTDAFRQKSTALATNICQDYLEQEINEEKTIADIQNDIDLASSLLRIQSSRFVQINSISFDSNYLIEPQSNINRAQAILLTDIVGIINIHAINFRQMRGPIQWLQSEQIAENDGQNSNLIDGSLLSIIQTNNNTYQLKNSSYDNWYLENIAFRQNTLSNSGSLIGIPIKSMLAQSQTKFNNFTVTNLQCIDCSRPLISSNTSDVYFNQSEFNDIDFQSILFQEQQGSLIRIENIDSINLTIENSHFENIQTDSFTNLHLISGAFDFEYMATITLLSSQFLKLNFNQSEGSIIGIQSGQILILNAIQQIIDSFINTFESSYNGGIINLYTPSASLQIKNTQINNIQTNGSAPFQIVSQDNINIQVSSNTIIKNVVGGQDGGIFYVSTRLLELTISDSAINQIFTNRSGGVVYIYPNDYYSGGVQLLNSQIGDIYADQGSIIYFNASLVAHDSQQQPFIVESIGNIYEFFNHQYTEWIQQNFPEQIIQHIFQTLEWEMKTQLATLRQEVQIPNKINFKVQT
ncbi:UNKNOWN [Stylonychia lemnae]|uniref:Uncharacterized protein n=1 Tax=Stylonychia lemnae TaxID=5949 RepID=A0A078A458_STYLE|nr:UNKNOWN [Stylonychia lemnae]|eukprot:CDW76932.1 UNKNOWN [Stylonychia lemnae]